MKDEEIEQAIPPECMHQENGHLVPDIHQMIVRRASVESPVRIHYTYSEQLLKEQNPHQLSYLFVHEWLRDYSENPWVIRTFNRFLHSQTARNASSADVRAFAQSMNLNLENGLTQRAAHANYSCYLDFVFASYRAEYCQEWINAPVSAESEIRKRCEDNQFAFGKLTKDTTCTQSYFQFGLMCSYFPNHGGPKPIRSTVYQRGSKAQMDWIYECQIAKGTIGTVP